MLLSVSRIQFGQEIEIVTLRTRRNWESWVQMVNGRPGGTELDTLIQGRKPAARPRHLTAAVVTCWVSQYDVSWKILVFSTQSIAYPSAERGAAREHFARLHHVDAFWMIVVLCVH